jgi:hypothetical protein
MTQPYLSSGSGNRKPASSHDWTRVKPAGTLLVLKEQQALGLQWEADYDDLVLGLGILTTALSGV